MTDTPTNENAPVENTLVENTEVQLQEVAPEATAPVEMANVEQTAQEFHEQESQSDTHKNLIALREKAIRAERERDDALRYAQQLKDAQSPKEESYRDIAADDLVEGKHLNKFNKRIDQLEGQLKEYKLKAKHSDFDKVVTKDNIETLVSTYPEVAEILNSSPDLYAQAASAYTLIKSLGIVPDDTFSKDREKAQSNAAKPRPLTSVSPQQGDSPLSRANAFANGLTPELSEQLWKEMNEARKKL